MGPEQFWGAKRRSAGSQVSAAAAEVWCLLFHNTGGHGFSGAATAELTVGLSTCSPHRDEPCRQKGFRLNSPKHKPMRNTLNILWVKSEFLSSFVACCVLISSPLSWQVIAIPSLYNKICCLCGPEVFL